jgi:hypothetical protein
MSDALVSIIESLAGAAAAAAERRQSKVIRGKPALAVQPWQAPPGYPPAPPVVEVAGSVPAAAVASRLQPVTPPVESQPAARLNVRGLIGGEDSLIRSIIAAEIIGPPIALRRHNPWDGPSV